MSAATAQVFPTVMVPLANAAFPRLRAHTNWGREGGRRDLQRRFRQRPAMELWVSASCDSKSLRGSSKDYKAAPILPRRRASVRRAQLLRRRTPFAQIG